MALNKGVGNNILENKRSKKVLLTFSALAVLLESLEAIHVYVDYFSQQKVPEN